MKLTSLYTLLLLGFTRRVVATPIELDLEPRGEKEMITVTIFDCNPKINFKRYRLLCYSENVGNICEAQQAAIPAPSPAAGSVGIGITIPLGSVQRPEGCEPGSEGLGPVGILHIEVGTEMTVGIVWFLTEEDDESKLSGEPRANKCTFTIKAFPGDFDVFWWFNAPVEINGQYQTKNGSFVPDAMKLVCQGTLSDMQ